MSSDPAEAQRLQEERRLVQRAQSGEPDALRPLFERYANALYGGVILPRLGDPTMAEDVLRETFVTAIEKIRSFAWQGHGVYAWLRQIAANKAIDVHRRAARAGRALALLAEESPAETWPEDLADETLIAAEERRRNAARIEQAMAAISERYREAIRLRLMEELPREQCAARMGVTLGNFDVLLFRAVRAFRRAFGERE